MTAVVMTAAQVYFTVQNYEINKLRFIGDVQQSLNTSIESYFANRAKKEILVFTNHGTDTLIGNRKPRALVKRLSDPRQLDSIKSITISNTVHTNIWATQSGIDTLILDSVYDENRGNYKSFVINADSTRVDDLRILTQKVMISMSEDLLNLGELHGVFKKELESRNLMIDFALRQQTQAGNTSIGELATDNFLSVSATSGYLREHNTISVDFENATQIILKNGIIDLLLSVLLIGLVISTLIYLYQVIYSQKQLAAIKDDLISNITHEFKTPIATIFSALEGVTSFNERNDPDKTKRYLSLSNDQLSKLNDMVEKMLETATIDQGKLSLNREETEVVEWTRSLVSQFAIVETKKQISYHSSLDSKMGMIDRFHLENALSNLIDNAIKYGGSIIHIRLRKEDESLIWEVEDDGGGIPRNQREKIFEKLYRIPTGNQHDVKGFGIGLYYARNIVQMHGGTLQLEAGDNKTLFRLKL